MKKAVFGFVAALALAGGLFAQQGIVIPGTPGPVNPVLISVDPVAGSTCSKPAIVEFNYVSYGVWVCGSTGGSLSAPFTWQLVNDNIGLSVGVSSIAAAATVAPTTTVVHITGNAAAISTITPPAGAVSGTHVTFISDGATGFTWTAASGTGQIKVASSGAQVVGATVTFTYDATTKLWYPSHQ